MTQYPQISFQVSCPHTPEQNDISERKHRHVVELGLANMFHASIPMNYWDVIFESVTFVINRLPCSPNNDVSPFEMLFNQKPNYQFFHVLGCACYPLLRPYNQTKLQPRSEKCALLGYSPVYKGYKCLHIPTGRIYISRHVKFDDSDLPFTYLHTTTNDETQPYPTPPQQPLSVIPHPSDNTTPNFSDHLISSPQITTIQQNQPSSSRNAPTTTSHSMMTRSKTQTLKPKIFPNHQLFTTTTSNHHPKLASVEPTCYTQAVKDKNWRLAMAAELDALAHNATWELVPPPSDAHVVGSKWLFRIKYKPDGSIEKYKARLVAKGYSQLEGIDYYETFSPVVKPSTVRVVLSIAISHNWPLHQLDVNNAFLHGDLEETVFMEQPPGFSDTLYPNHVCKLKKAIYGLKQAPRAWFFKLKEFLTTHQFVSSQCDHSLFILKTTSTIMYLLVYVDDIIITGNSPKAIDKLIKTLDAEFSIKDLGELSYFLGIQVSSFHKNLHLSQHRYLQTVLTRAAMADAKPCQTPMQAGIQPSKFEGSLLENPHMYRSIVGALQYATITRPDLTFAVNKASQFVAAPTEKHWQLVKRILRYIRGTLHHGLIIKPSTDLSIHAYCDADWAGCPDDRRSTTGYAVYMGCNLISWSAKKQATVSRSSTEAEYRSLAVTTQEVLWLNYLLLELGYVTKHVPTLWCDNLGATFLAANPVFHARTKHIELDFHFVREKVNAKQLSVRFICSNDQLGDIFTKSLAKARFHCIRDKLNVIHNPLSLRGPIEETDSEEIETVEASSSNDTGQD
ncbi:hypothetical protein LUZ62_052322 [Rhynchospora pubera]|uniref:Integrase catalytic domain-containing protein n=1 Tax=Rhynchospora pubera TaxID=906938 RepID=A0AAV8GCD6_9POAL|nr:hypothetical protein LUZ62_052322 [Rhynchospora pubera]